MNAYALLMKGDDMVAVYQNNNNSVIIFFSRKLNSKVKVTVCFEPPFGVVNKMITADGYSKSDSKEIQIDERKFLYEAINAIKTIHDSFRSDDTDAYLRVQE